MTAFTDGFNAGASAVNTARSLALRLQELNNQKNYYDGVLANARDRIELANRQLDHEKKAREDAVNAAKNLGYIAANSSSNPSPANQAAGGTPKAAGGDLKTYLTQGIELYTKNPAAGVVHAWQNPLFRNAIAEAFGGGKDTFYPTGGGDIFQPRLIQLPDGRRGYVLVSKNKEGKTVYLTEDRKQGDSDKGVPPVVIPEQLANELAYDFYGAGVRQVLRDTPDADRYATMLVTRRPEDAAGEDAGAQQTANPLASPPPQGAPVTEAPGPGAFAQGAQQPLAQAPNQAQAGGVPNDAAQPNGEPAVEDSSPTAYLDQLAGQAAELASRAENEFNSQFDETVSGLRTVYQAEGNPLVSTHPLNSDPAVVQTIIKRAHTVAQEQLADQKASVEAQKSAAEDFTREVGILKNLLSSDRVDSPVVQRAIGEHLSKAQEHAQVLGIPFDASKFGAVPLPAQPQQPQQQQPPQQQQQQQQPQQHPFARFDFFTPPSAGGASTRVSSQQSVTAPPSTGLPLGGVQIPKEQWGQVAKDMKLAGASFADIQQFLATGTLYPATVEAMARIKEAEAAKVRNWKELIAEANKSTAKQAENLIKRNKDLMAYHKQVVDAVTATVPPLERNGKTAPNTEFASTFADSFVALTGVNPYLTEINPSAIGLAARKAYAFHASHPEVPIPVATSVALATAFLPSDERGEQLAQLVTALYKQNGVDPKQLPTILQNALERGMAVYRETNNEEASWNAIFGTILAAHKTQQE